jgi:hypothetical protein
MAVPWVRAIDTDISPRLPFDGTSHKLGLRREREISADDVDQAIGSLGIANTVDCANLEFLGDPPSDQFTS